MHLYRIPKSLILPSLQLEASSSFYNQIHRYDPKEKLPKKSGASVLGCLQPFLRSHSVMRTMMCDHNQNVTEYPEQLINLFKVNNKETRKTSMTLFWCLSFYLWTDFQQTSFLYFHWFRTLFWCFLCWLWARKCWLGNCAKRKAFSSIDEGVFRNLFNIYDEAFSRK